MNKKKEILFIIVGLVGGGAEKALVNLLRVIDKTLYHVELLVVFGDKIGDIELPNVTIIPIFPSASNLLYKLAKQLYIKLQMSFLLRYITRMLISKKYDTIISYVEGNTLLYHSFLYDKTKNNVSWVHTDFVENHWSKYHFVKNDEYKAYASLNKLVFVSEYAQKQFAKVFDLPHTVEQYVCANVINVDEIKAKSLEPIDDIVKTKFTICSVGRLEKVKGYDMVIDAAKILRNRHVNVDFWIVGTGSEEEFLKERMHHTHCEDMVHFLGYKLNPYPYMRIADVYLSSSYAEGLPLVFCEAQCLGKPIIATRTIGALELLKNNVSNRLIEFSASAIANQIEDCVINKWYLNNCNLFDFDIKTILNQLYLDIL